MKIYLSVDPEVTGGETIENLKKLTEFIQEQGHIVFRAPYVLANDPEKYLRDVFGNGRELSAAEQRKLHMQWIDESDLLIAELSLSSEGRAMIIQRALDKPRMGLSKTPIIFIKGKQFPRKFGRIVRGLIEGREVTYFEYNSIQDVITNWPQLCKEAKG